MRKRRKRRIGLPPLPLFPSVETPRACKPHPRGGRSGSSAGPNRVMRGADETSTFIFSRSALRSWAINSVRFRSDCSMSMSTVVLPIFWPSSLSFFMPIQVVMRDRARRNMAPYLKTSVKQAARYTTSQFGGLVMAPFTDVPH